MVLILHSNLHLLLLLIDPIQSSHTSSSWQSHVMTPGTQVSAKLSFVIDKLEVSKFWFQMILLSFFFHFLNRLVSSELHSTFVIASSVQGASKSGKRNVRFESFLIAAPGGVALTVTR